MRDWRTALADAAWALVMVALAAALVLACAPVQAQQVQQVPKAALKYRAELTRNARAVWGLEAPVATFAAQVHQESAWRPLAVSRVGAAGLAQFMPGTSAWIAGRYPELARNEPFHPGWALRALVTYDRWLYERTRAASGCEHWAFVLSAYNGGLGWVQRDARLAASRGLDARVWFGAVETVNAGRSAANWHENRGYPARILRRLEPAYVAAGWGRGVCS